MVAHARIGDLREQALEPRLEGRAPLRRVDVPGFQLAQPHDVDEGRGRGQTLGERARALRAHEVVGIGPLGQEGEAEGMAFAQMGQHAVDGARGGRLARAVAVEADHGLGRERHSRSICRSVKAVPRVATTFSKPAWWSAITSI